MEQVETNNCEGDPDELDVMMSIQDKLSSHSRRRRRRHIGVPRVSGEPEHLDEDSSTAELFSALNSQFEKSVESKN